MLPKDAKFTPEHEWVKLAEGVAVIGVSDYAQEQLTDIVFVELPAVGTKLSAGDSLAVLESVKSVSDVYSPVGGEVVEVNSSLEDQPELINDQPFEGGWLAKIKVDGEPDLSALMDAEKYQTYLDGL